MAHTATHALRNVRLTTSHEHFEQHVRVIPIKMFARRTFPPAWIATAHFVSPRFDPAARNGAPTAHALPRWTAWTCCATYWDAQQEKVCARSLSAASSIHAQALNLLREDPIN